MGRTDDAEMALRQIVADLAPGLQLPSERELVTILGVGRTAVRLILTRLEGAGRVRSRQGMGWFRV